MIFLDNDFTASITLISSFGRVMKKKSSSNEGLPSSIATTLYSKIDFSYIYIDSSLNLIVFSSYCSELWEEEDTEASVGQLTSDLSYFYPGSRNYKNMIALCYLS